MENLGFYMMYVVEGIFVLLLIEINILIDIKRYWNIMVFLQFYIKMRFLLMILIF